jgi:DUF4097 and DUF4098 domain-containing protein YvlB
MKSILGTLFLTLGFMQVAAQSHTEKITREFSFENKGSANALIVANVNGNVKVEGYSGEKILVEVTKHITAKTPERLEKGMSEISLGVVDLADTIILYVDGLCGGFGRDDHKSRNYKQSGKDWNYSWSRDCRDCNLGYDYKLDFVIRLPSTVNLDASTINHGDVSVSHVNGIVAATNINGNIQLEDLTQESLASTINGNVDIVYARNPLTNCRFYSLNGDINAWFQKGLAATMSFESFNGNFFTNIDRLEALPAEVEKSDTSKGVKYKINGNRYKIGAGGATLDFETFNGNVYLKEK